MRIALVWVLLFAVPAFADSNSGDKILATYADDQISFEELADREPAMVSWIGIGTGAEQIEQSVEGIVFDRLLAREAQATGIADQPEVREQIVRVLSSAYLKKHAPKSEIQVDPKEAEQVYKKNIDKYKSQEQFKVAHILVSSRQQAKELISSLRGGAEWSDLAAKYSTDPISAKRGGALGLIPPYQLLPQLREEVRTLESGEVGGPVQSPFGFHIVKLEERPSVTYRPFDEVKKEIYSELVRQKNRENVREIRESLWKKYKVSINSSTIEEVVKVKSADNAHVERASLGKQRRQPGDPTDLQVVSESIDLGKIPAGKITESFLLTNTSGRDISIYRVGSTCKCIEASVEPKVLPPSSVGKLTFTYDPEVFKDKNRIERMIFIESSDSLEPRKFVRISAQLPEG